MKDLFNQVDKLKHMCVCAVLMVWFKVILEVINPYGGLLNTVSAGIIVLLVAITKELVDYFTKKGVASWRDFYADIIGLLSTFLPLMFI